MATNRIQLDYIQYAEIANFWKKLRKNVHKYGNENDACWRVKTPSRTFQHEFDEDDKTMKLFTYTVGYIYEHREYPNKPDTIFEISHCCGNVNNSKRSLCINGAHMMLETRKQNCERKKCHNYIRKYANQYKKESIFNRGEITVQDINTILSKDEQYHSCECTDTKKCFISFGKL